MNVAGPLLQQGVAFCQSPCTRIGVIENGIGLRHAEIDRHGVLDAIAAAITRPCVQVFQMVLYPLFITLCHGNPEQSRNIVVDIAVLAKAFAKFPRALGLLFRGGVIAQPLKRHAEIMAGKYFQAERPKNFGCVPRCAKNGDGLDPLLAVDMTQAGVEGHEEFTPNLTGAMVDLLGLLIGSDRFLIHSEIELAIAGCEQGFGFVRVIL